MKILFVHNYYQQFGGEDSVAITESKMLTERGQDVLFWSRHNDEIKDYNALQKAAFFPNTIYSRRTVHDVEAIIAEQKPDVAYLHNLYPLISPSIYTALKKAGVPVIQVLHDFRPFCANGWFYIDGKVCEKCIGGNHSHAFFNRCYKNSYPLSALYSLTLQVNRWAGLVDKVDYFICLTGFFKQKIMEAGVPENKILIRPNFITAPVWPDPPSQPGDYGVFLGRLSNEKGVRTLLRAFQQLPDVPLKVVGTGPIENDLKQFAAANRMKNVEFMGFRSGDEKWNLLRNSKFALVTSECYENFPISALEHFAASKPVVCSRIGGLPYIIEDGKTGYHFEAGNPDDLAAKVRLLLSDPQKASEMGSLARQRVETRYGPDEGYNNLIQIFEKVIAR